MIFEQPATPMVHDGLGLPVMSHQLPTAMRLRRDRSWITQGTEFRDHATDTLHHVQGQGPSSFVRDEAWWNMVAPRVVALPDCSWRYDLRILTLKI